MVPPEEVVSQKGKSQTWPATLCAAQIAEALPILFSPCNGGGHVPKHAAKSAGRSSKYVWKDLAAKCQWLKAQLIFMLEYQRSETWTGQTRRHTLEVHIPYGICENTFA